MYLQQNAISPHVAWLKDELQIVNVKDTEKV